MPTEHPSTQNNEQLILSNLYCIGRNYAQHAKELGNTVPSEPVVFLKTLGALGPHCGDFKLFCPTSDETPQHELELVLYIEKGGFQIPEEKALTHLGGFALGLDLTLRKKQRTLSEAGKPWALAKSFYNSALVGPIVQTTVDEALLTSLSYSLEVNGSIRQVGSPNEMIFHPKTLISFISQVVPLQKGDLIFTGTPSGVGAIQPGDSLTAKLKTERLKGPYEVSWRAL